MNQRKSTGLRTLIIVGLSFAFTLPVFAADKATKIAKPSPLQHGNESNGSKAGLDPNQLNEMAASHPAEIPTIEPHKNSRARQRQLAAKRRQSRLTSRNGTGLPRPHLTQSDHAPSSFDLELAALYFGGTVAHGAVELGNSRSRLSLLRQARALVKKAAWFAVAHGKEVAFKSGNVTVHSQLKLNGRAAVKASVRAGDDLLGSVLLQVNKEAGKVRFVKPLKAKRSRWVRRMINARPHRQQTRRN